MVNLWTIKGIFISHCKLQSSFTCSCKLNFTEAVVEDGQTVYKMPYNSQSLTFKWRVNELIGLFSNIGIPFIDYMVKPCK